MRRHNEILMSAIILLWAVVPSLLTNASATPLDDLCNSKDVSMNRQIESNGAYVLVIDNEDAAFYIESGNWSLNYDGAVYYYYKYVIDGPGDGSARCVWVAEGLPWGNYDVDFYADNGNYARDTHYIVEHAEGTTTCIVNHNYVASGWRPVGNFDFRGIGRVTLTDEWTSEGVRVMADALKFTLNGTATPPTEDVGTPKISLVIDDAGAEDPSQTWTNTYKLLHLSRPMTVAVMPFRSYSEEVAQAAVAQGFEVILHQPMQAVSSANPGAGAIWDYMNDAQVLATVQANLNSLPEAVGMNNHMGSLISQDENKMQIVANELKSRGMFFIDSRTISTSVAYDIAMDTPILTGERDLFVDGNSKSEAKDLIKALATKALYAPNEAHIGIGHVRSGTIAALEEMIPELESMGVELVPVSESISHVLETDRQPQDATFSTSGSWMPSEDDLFSKELINGDAFLAPCSTTGLSVEATFHPNLQHDGYYHLYVGWHEVATPAADARVTIHCSGGRFVRSLDLGARPNAWHYLGRYFFRAGSSGYVTLDDSNVTTPGQTIIVDGIKWIFDEHVTPAPICSWGFY